MPLPVEPAQRRHKPSTLPHWRHLRSVNLLASVRGNQRQIQALRASRGTSITSRVRPNHSDCVQDGAVMLVSNVLDIKEEKQCASETGSSLAPASPFLAWRLAVLSLRTRPRNFHKPVSTWGSRRLKSVLRPNLLAKLLPQKPHRHLSRQPQKPLRRQRLSLNLHPSPLPRQPPSLSPHPRQHLNLSLHQLRLPRPSKQLPPKCLPR